MEEEPDINYSKWGKSKIHYLLLMPLKKKLSIFT